MKKIDLGQTITILANVGVIAGIVFLALELRQSQLVERSQVRNEITLAYLQMTQNDMIMSDELLLAITRSKDIQLSEADEVRIGLQANNWLRLWENTYYQYRQGLFDDDEFRAVEASMRNRLGRNAPLRERFCLFRANGGISDRFVAYVDSILDTPCE